MSSSSRHDAFRTLHRRDEVLLLPNGWDFASIATLARVGFAAIGTTSLGVAAAAGKPDAAGTTRTETLALARRTSDLALLTVDVEGGFSDDPDEVAALAVELDEAGVVGVNIEDGRAGGGLEDADRQAAVIATVKRAVPRLFVNARTDTYWLAGQAASVAETTRRLQAYAAAGADGVFVPGVADRATIAELAAATDLPLNVLYSSGCGAPQQLTELGVRRVSLGSLLFRVSLHALAEAATSIRDGAGGPAPSVPTYADVESLVRGAVKET